MARLNPGFSDEEFIGYTFRGVPERRPRLWFLDRDLFTLMLWEQHLMTYQQFPPLQAPETYNLTGILNELKKAGHAAE